MQTSFIGLVGSTPANGINIEELIDLTHALDTATTVHDMAAQASEATNSSAGTLCPIGPGC